jgi:hypothetical protein
LGKMGKGKEIMEVVAKQDVAALQAQRPPLHVMLEQEEQALSSSDSLSIVQQVLDNYNNPEFLQPPRVNHVHLEASALSNLAQLAHRVLRGPLHRNQEQQRARHATQECTAEPLDCRLALRVQLEAPVDPVSLLAPRVLRAATAEPLDFRHVRSAILGNSMVLQARRNAICAHLACLHPYMVLCRAPVALQVHIAF